MKIITAYRPKGGGYGISSDIVKFSKKDEWDYKWVSLHFGIKLKPGEKKTYKIEKIK